jgi:hypothetical protein
MRDNVHATGPRQELPSITCEGKPLTHLTTPVVNWYAPAGAGLTVVALNLPRVSLADDVAGPTRSRTGGPARHGSGHSYGGVGDESYQKTPDVEKGKLSSATCGWHLKA